MHVAGVAFDDDAELEDSEVLGDAEDELVADDDAEDELDVEELDGLAALLSSSVSPCPQAAMPARSANPENTVNTALLTRLHVDRPWCSGLIVARSFGVCCGLFIGATLLSADGWTTKGWLGGIERAYRSVAHADRPCWQINSTVRSI